MRETSAKAGGMREVRVAGDGSRREAAAGWLSGPTGMVGPGHHYHLAAPHSPMRGPTPPPQHRLHAAEATRGAACPLTDGVTGAGTAHGREGQ